MTIFLRFLIALAVTFNFFAGEVFAKKSKPQDSEIPFIYSKTVIKYKDKKGNWVVREKEEKTGEKKPTGLSKRKAEKALKAEAKKKRAFIKEQAKKKQTLAKKKKKKQKTKRNNSVIKKKKKAKGRKARIHSKKKKKVKAKKIRKPHTGSGNRTNLPQLRCDLQSEEAVKMAVAFGVPVLLKARLREGSLREASEKIGIPTITFEGGEALRWTELSIKAAAEGVLRVMEFLDMISLKGGLSEAQKPVISPYSRWLRAPITGMFRSTNELGDEIFKGDVIGKISDPLGEKTTDVKSSLNGIIVGKTQDPVVYKGDALFNVAWVPDPTKAEESIEEIEEKEMSLCVDDPESY